MREITTTARHAGLDEIRTILQSQADVRYDVVVPAANLESVGGVWHVKNGLSTVEGITGDGELMESTADARLRPTPRFDGHVADRLDIPVKYVRRMRDEAIGLYDTNVNHWLNANRDRPFLMRGFHDGDAGSLGIGRALLSDRYGIVDNLDMTVAVMKGIVTAGVDPSSVNISGDLTADKFYLTVSAPQINVMAEALLENYRSPYQNDNPEPIVFAGLVIQNSETGGGAFLITPRIVVRICNNGMTIKKDALRAIHLGSKLEEGRVRWSEETATATLDLVTAKAKDAVATFLDRDYLQEVVDGLTEKALTPITEPVAVVERVAKDFGFTDAEKDGVFADFITGGQVTTGGLVQAITSFAQRVDDAERAHELEDLAVPVLEAIS